jgi:hypothetical protein
MHHILKTMLIVLCASAFTFTAAKAQAQKSAQTQARAEQASDAELAMEAMRRCEHGCHDCWYALFPGVVNYCLGKRAWKNGSYRSGLHLLELAGGWGNKHAQYTLGLIYFNGDHMAADRARGIAWLMLANERHNDTQTDLVTRSAVHLATPQQYKRAQRLFQEMRKKYGDEVAGVRAWRHLRNRLGEATFMAKNSCILESGGVVPWSHGFVEDPHVLCMPSDPFGKNVTGIASEYFDGLTGAVTVGPLQQVPAPASSSTR